MWQNAINYLRSLQTYRDLSPDVGIRRRINVCLSKRPALALDQWSALFSQVEDDELSKQVILFIYVQLPIYSGLEVGRLRPSDRLIEDLQLPLVCWFDWPNQLCCDFYDQFHVDISEVFDESLLETVGDLVDFLYQQLQSHDSITPG